jgi:hypothetical protein
MFSGDATAQIDTAGLKTRNGEFVAEELELRADIDVVTTAVVKDAVTAIANGRRQVMAFACGVKHAMHLCEALREAGVTSEIVTGLTDKAQRKQIIADYKAGLFRCLVIGLHGVIVAVAGEVDGNVFHAVGEHCVQLHLRGGAGHVNARHDAELFRG